jgi:hypothetical protein
VINHLLDHSRPFGGLRITKYGIEGKDDGGRGESKMMRLSGAGAIFWWDKGACLVQNHLRRLPSHRGWGHTQRSHYHCDIAHSYRAEGENVRPMALEVWLSIFSTRRLPIIKIFS